MPEMRLHDLRENEYRSQSQSGMYRSEIGIMRGDIPELAETSTTAMATSSTTTMTGNETEKEKG